MITTNNDEPTVPELSDAQYHEADEAWVQYAEESEFRVWDGIQEQFIDGYLAALKKHPQPTTPTREQIKALTAAVSALEIHAESCGHRRHDSLCAYCDDARIAKNARKALALFSPALPEDGR